MTKFDSNRAWTEATALVKANVSVGAAVIGVFTVLPLFALTLLAPPPEPPAGAEPKALVELMGTYYSTSWPLLAGVAVLQMLGALTMLALFTDRQRPTVAEAIRQGGQALLPSLAANLMAAIAVGLALMVPLTLAGLTGSIPFVGLVLLFGLVGVVYVIVRISMIGPVAIAEERRNPVRILARTWRLTAASAWRLMLFYALLFVAMWVLVMVGSGVVDLGLRLMLGKEIGGSLGAFVGAALQGVMALYFTAAYAATYRQLAGPSAAATATAFD